MKFRLNLDFSYSCPLIRILSLASRDNYLSNSQPFSCVQSVTFLDRNRNQDQIEKYRNYRIYREFSMLSILSLLLVHSLNNSRHLRTYTRAYGQFFPGGVVNHVPKHFPKFPKFLQSNGTQTIFERSLHVVV